MGYNYREEMVKDIKKYIVDNYMEPEPGMTRDEYEERLGDELWDVDEITGNGGMYYADEDTCAGYVGYGLPDLIDALEEFGYDFTHDMVDTFRAAPARYIDCLIRTYILYECVSKAVDELGYKFEA